MGTPITFSGFNDIDFNVVLTSLMQRASLPLTTLETRQRELRSQISSYDALAGHVAALRGAADALGTMSGLQTAAGQSSHPQTVTVAAASDVAVGHYDVVVEELARAQVTVSATSVPDADTTIVATGGSLDIDGVLVSIGGGVTLQQLATTINTVPGIGVTATVVRAGAASFRLALTSNMTGAAAAFTIGNSLAGGTGITFGDANGDGVSGDSAADNAVNATDASILINNIPATSASNTFDNVITGLSLTVLRKDPTTTVSVDVGPDTAAIKGKLQTFVQAYNDFMGFLGEQRLAAAGGDNASIGREPVLRQLHLALRSALVGSHGSGTLTRLAEAGIELTSTGQLQLNEGMFDAAVAADPDAVRTLFAASNGAFSSLEQVLSAYSQADGLIPESKKRLQAQIASMDVQIEALQRRLALQREALQKEFAEADLIMSRLKNQAGSLAGFGNGLGSF